MFGKALGWMVGLLAAGIEAIRDARRIVTSSRQQSLKAPESEPIPLTRRSGPSSRYDA